MQLDRSCWAEILTGSEAWREHLDDPGRDPAAVRCSPQQDLPAALEVGRDVLCRQAAGSEHAAQLRVERVQRVGDVLVRLTLAGRGALAGGLPDGVLDRGVSEPRAEVRDRDHADNARAVDVCPRHNADSRSLETFYATA
jgi:hypothetical protein